MSDAPKSVFLKRGDVTVCLDGYPLGGAPAVFPGVLREDGRPNRWRVGSFYKWRWEYLPPIRTRRLRGAKQPPA